MTTVMIRDETMSGATIREVSVEIPGERITASELIRSRVYQEVKELNARTASTPTEAEKLVPLTSTEVTLNGPRSKQAAPVDWRTHLKRALEAFKANQILILVDGQQVASLDEHIDITPSTEISFLRLTMLMGG